MPRASKPCNTHGCPNLQPCADHAPKPWQRTGKRSTLSGSRQQQRSRYVIERDDGICHVCGHAGANEADHVIPTSEGGADDVTNMRAIHGRGSGLPCHKDKTAAEAARGLRALGRAG